MTFDLESRQEGVSHVFFPTKLQRTLRRGLCKMARHPNISLEWRSKNMLLKGSFTRRKFVKTCAFHFANLVLNLFKFSSLALIFPLESCSFTTSLRDAVTDTSTSQSARFDRSLKLSEFSFRTLKTLRLPIPNNNEVVSQPVTAWAAGRILVKTALRVLQISCTGI